MRAAADPASDRRTPQGDAGAPLDLRTSRRGRRPPCSHHRLTDSMPSKEEITQQVERETEWRSRLAVPAFAGGVFYLLSGIITNSVASNAPTVGVLQGLTPALSGGPSPTVSPRAPEVKYLSHHASSLIIASVIAAIAIVVLTLVLLVLTN